MDDEDAWEALDVDDSDLPSLVRPPTLLPCKRPLNPPLQSQTQNPNKLNNNINKPFLSLCSQSSRFSQNEHKLTNPETLVSQSQQQTLPHFENQKNNDDPPSTSYQRLIPGPAGRVQAAMKNRQAARNNQTDEDRISTQEYLMKSSEENENEDDEDFKGNSWLCAMEFLVNESNSMVSSVFEEGFVLESKLTSIKNCVTIERVPLVVAIVKSCTPNGLGDLSVTLKDPTGTVSASIHRKAITEGVFGKDIAVGSVLILKQVVVFSPSSSAHYLNITLPNLLKVISKDSGPPTKGYQASTVRLAAWAIEECGKTRAQIAEKASDTRIGAAEGITDEVVRENTNKQGSVDDNRQVEESRAARESSHCNGRLEDLLGRERAAKRATFETVRGDAKNKEQKIDDINSRTNGGSSFESLKCSSSSLHDSSAEKIVDHLQHQEIGSTSGYKKQTQQLIPTTSLPEWSQWTDEQLNELCADNWEDGTPLF